MVGKRVSVQRRVLVVVAVVGALATIAFSFGEKDAPVAAVKHAIRARTAITSPRRTAIATDTSKRERAPARPAGPTAAQLARCPWLNSRLSVIQRVDELLRAMTPLQEADLLHLYWGGSSTNPYEGLSPAIPSLCIPAITEQDGAAGVGDSWRTAVSSFRAVTQLPAPIADAAAFDTSLAAAYGRVIGAEDAGVGVDMALAPTINIERDPLWGRAYESLGEDPYLTGALAVPLIDGIQSQRVVAVVKHFAAYNQETGRGTLHDDSIVSDRALHEIYLPAWATAVQLAHPGGVMCAYNLINGVPSCQDGPLLNGELRGVWKFAGFVRSDCGSVFNQAASMAAGVSQVKCSRLYQPDQIVAAIKSGGMTRANLNSLVRPVLSVLFRFNLVAAPHPARPDADVSTRADQAVALRTADESAVLLKNDGLLPLNLTHLRSLALIGPDGGTPMSAGYGAMRVHPEHVTTTLQALQQALSSRLLYNDGSNLRAAADVARRASVAVVVVNDVESEGKDRTSLSLPRDQNALIRAVEAANPRTVVVLETGAPVLLPWLATTPALLETWYPGDQAGASLIALLSGKVDPSGKLPVTWPASAWARPDTAGNEFGADGRPTDYSEGIGVGYRWYQSNGVQPAFSFGDGLSYTSFGFSHLSVTPRSGGGWNVVASVTNTGRRAGAEVAQCYVGYPPATGEPPRQLRGFQRVQLAPGQTATVHFALTAGDLAQWDTAHSTWTVNGGRYTMYVGDGSDVAHLPLHATVTAAAANLGPDSGPGPAPAAS